MPDAIPFSDRFLNLHQACEMVGLGKSSIYRMMDSDAFPKPRQVGEKAVRWLESELAIWMRSRPQAGTEAGILSQPGENRNTQSGA